MCETSGCQQPPEHVVYFRDPEESRSYCDLCAQAQYQDPKAYAMIDMGSANKISGGSDLPEFEEVVGDEND